MNENGEQGILLQGDDHLPIMLVGNLKGEVHANHGDGRTRSVTDAERERFFRTLYMGRTRHTDIIDKVRSYAMTMVRSGDSERMAIGLEIIDLLLEKKNPAG